MRLSPWRVRWGAFLAFVASLGVVGCGSSAGTVSGKVTYQGSALKGGRVTFIPAKGQSVTAEIGEDGSYTISNVPAGEAKITVETKYLAKRASLPAYKPPPGAPGGYKPPNPEDSARRYTPIPDSYAEAATSDLTYAVKAGRQDHEIKLAGDLTPTRGAGGGKGSGSKGGRPK